MQWTSGPHPDSLGPGGYGGGGSSASGTITATLTWTPSQPEEAPPSYVYLVENSTATATAGTGTPSPQADNGLDSILTTTVNNIAPTYSQTTVKMTGSRLTYYNLGGTTTQITATCSPTASGQIGCGVTYTAGVTNIQGEITSSIDTSYFKGSNGLPQANNAQNGIKLQLSPRYGDTFVDPSSGITQSPLLPPYEYLVIPQFNAVVQGFAQNPYHSWTTEAGSWSDEPWVQYTYINPQYVISTSLLNNMGIGPYETNVSLSVTDQNGGGASLSLLYKLRIHNLYDTWTVKQQLPPNSVDMQLTTPTPHVAKGGGTIACQWVEPGPEWSYMTGQMSSLLSVASAACTNPYFAAGFAAAGIGIATLGPKANSNNCQWAWHADYTSYGGPASTITGGTWSDLQSGYQMVPHLALGYSNTLWQADNYGPNGFIGEALDIKSKPNGNYFWTGAFSPNVGI